MLSVRRASMSPVMFTRTGVDRSLSSKGLCGVSAETASIGAAFTAMNPKWSAVDASAT